MHIPTGLLSTPVAGASLLLGGAAVVLSSWRVNRRLEETHVPLLGVSGAFVFAAQMLNFPIPLPGATSGHFLGGALVGVLLGPAAAVLVMASVLTIQCFVFQDGGPDALGANLLNTAVSGGLLGALAHRLARGKEGLRRAVLLPAAFVAGWLSCLLGALACALELVVSGTVPEGTSATAVVLGMGGVHALIGLGEGAITAAALGLLLGVRPDLLALERV